MSLRYFVFRSMARTAMAVGLLWPAIALAQLPNARLTSVYPPSGPKGGTVEVAIKGIDLDGATALHFSHPGITAQAKVTSPDDLPVAPEVSQDQFVVSIDKNVPPGTYELRAIGAFGITNARAFFVGEREELLKEGGNTTPEKAMPVPLGAAVCGQATKDGVDYYKVELKKGQRVIFEGIAQRLDSRMDATLVLYDAAGRELARSLDYDRSEPLIDFTAPADGEYLLGVSDFIYEGGPDYAYRVVVRQGPYIDFVLPPAGQPGQRQKFTLYGRNLPGGKPAGGFAVDGQPLEKLEVDIDVPQPDDPRASDLAGQLDPSETAVDGFPYRLEGKDASSNAVSIGFAYGPVTLEQEPNDAADKAQKITVPGEYVGQFLSARDRDWIEFEAQAGEVYWIEILAQRLGQLIDPYLSVHRVTRNDKGEEQVSPVKDTDDTNMPGADPRLNVNTEDPVFKLVVDTPGTYRVMVRDLYRQGGDPRLVYRLIVRQPTPDYRLLALARSKFPSNGNQVAFDIGSPLLRKGGSALLEVFALRQDEFDGDIEVSVEGLPKGVSCQGAVIGPNSGITPLVLTADENVKPWAGPIRIVGRAKTGQREIVRQARYGANLWEVRDMRRERVAVRLTRDITMAVVDNETDPASVVVGDGQTLETSLGGKLEVPVKVTRYGDFKADLKLTPLGLPNDLKPGDVTVKGSEKEGKLSLALTSNRTPLGTYTFYLRGETQTNYARNPAAITAAEERVKDLEKSLTDLQAEAKKAADAKNAAAAEAKSTADKVKQAETALAETKKSAPQDVPAAQAALDEAQQAAQTAADALTAADAESQRAAARAKAVDDMKKANDKRVADLKKASAPKNTKVGILSTPVTLRIHAAPIEVSPPPASVTVKAESDAEVKIDVQRLFGFEDAVEINFEPPRGVSGLSAGKVNVEKGKPGATLKVTAAKGATEGVHEVTLRLKARFNNVSVETTCPLTVVVEAAQQPKT